ncbi:MAG: hypothetical protein AMJ69_11130 [Gammaproteobacteria bacterium SG8_47]|nr:MAG: hypothetical protein AMJ69_11130 [Gammaproteobacteria bacterium SG8_47]
MGRSLIVAAMLSSPIATVAAGSGETSVADGKQLFETRCGGLCHQLPEPGMLRAKQWTRVLETMQLRMRQVGMPPLSEAELSRVSAYLDAHARP